SNLIMNNNKSVMRSASRIFLFRANLYKPLIQAALLEDAPRALRILWRIAARVLGKNAGLFRKDRFF
ncbi:MAG: hypothetical protein J6P03_03735, partial [Opitutales bacterium]|nr:hypothetical protein [Opitutales bacterium]